MTSTADAVGYELRDNGVAVLTLNRPDRLNAWGMDLAVPFYRLIDEADADEAVRVIVVTGAGRGFCAGADLSGGGATSTESLGDDLGNTDENALGAILGERQPYTLTALRKPVIAAINGPCIGFGFTLALMCDVRFAAASAKFGWVLLPSKVSRGSCRGWWGPRPPRTCCCRAVSSTRPRPPGSVW